MKTSEGDLYFPISLPFSHQPHLTNVDSLYGWCSPGETFDAGGCSFFIWKANNGIDLCAIFAKYSLNYGKYMSNICIIKKCFLLLRRTQIQY